MNYIRGTNPGLSYVIVLSGAASLIWDSLIALRTFDILLYSNFVVIICLLQDDANNKETTGRTELHH